MARPKDKTIDRRERGNTNKYGSVKYQCEYQTKESVQLR
jgi:hypothetical protein